LKLKYDETLSNFAFNFSSRPYNVTEAEAAVAERAAAVAAHNALTI
jgi:hypothetical protein